MYFSCKITQLTFSRFKYHVIKSSLSHLFVFTCYSLHWPCQVTGEQFGLELKCKWIHSLNYGLLNRRWPKTTTLHYLSIAIMTPRMKLPLVVFSTGWVDWNDSILTWETQGSQSLQLLSVTEPRIPGVVRNSCNYGNAWNHLQWVNAKQWLWWKSFP